MSPIDNQVPRGVGPLRRVSRFVVDKPFPIACALALLGIGWLLAQSRNQPHHVRAVFSNAMSIARGLDVQIDGVDVGKVGKVEYDQGRAIVQLGIEDKDWPLPRGTTAVARFGTTLGNGTRFIEIHPARSGGGNIPEDGVIPVTGTTSTVEFDQIFNTFSRGTRRHVQAATGRMGTALAPHSAELNRGLRSTPGAVESTASVFEDLSRDDAALRKLVTDGDRVTRVLGTRRSEISGLVDVAATTFDSFATHANGIRDSLTQFAPALREAHTTLARLDGSVSKIDDLVDDARPGAKALRGFAADARPTVRALSHAMPVALDTVRVARLTAPDITKLLTEGQPFSQHLDPAMAGLAPSLGCIRPYAPEIAGMLSNWASFTQSFDGKAHVDRTKVNFGPSSFTNYPVISTDAFLTTTGQTLKYAMPRPPGLDSGQPWFLPECGAGPDALNPKKDPEDHG